MEGFSLLFSPSVFNGCRIRENLLLIEGLILLREELDGIPLWNYEAQASRD